MPTFCYNEYTKTKKDNKMNKELYDYLDKHWEELMELRSKLVDSRDAIQKNIDELSVKIDENQKLRLKIVKGE